MSNVVDININNKPLGILEGSKNSNNAQGQEINDLTEFLKLDYKKYIQYKIIYDTLEECISENNGMDHILNIKVKDILLGGNVAQSLMLDDNVDENNTLIFNSPFVSDPDLSFTERNQLQEVLKSRLDEKYKNISKEFCQVTNKDIHKTLENVEGMVPLQMSAEDTVLLEFKNKLISEQKQYVENLLSLLDTLNEIANLRLKKLPHVTDQKVRACQVEEKTNHLKSLLAQEKIRVDVFMETSNSLKAYKELIKDIREQQHDCQREIEHLKELKEKYNHVSCKQYDDILKSYLQYKSAIEKKKLLYDCLKT